MFLMIATDTVHFMRVAFPFFAALVFSLFLIQQTFANFTDTNGHPYEEAIQFVQDKGIVQGYADGTFRPDAPINRAEFTKIIIEATLPDESGGDCFPDVSNQWFAPFVCSAKRKELVGGYPDGTFKPDRHVTFAEAAKIVAIAHGLPPRADPIWYKPYVDALRERRAVPSSIARMDQKLSRGEMAAIIFALKGGGKNAGASDDRGLDDYDVSPSEQKLWEQRIEAALAPTPCPEIAVPTFPATFYRGLLIDTHLHLPAINDFTPGYFSDDDEEQEGRFGGPRAVLGENVRMSEIVCNLKREGTMKNFAFFPVYDSMPKQSVQIARRTMQTYPDSFTPFLMTPGPGDEVPTLDAGTIENVLSYYPGLFGGYGEIGLYALDGIRGGFPPDHKAFQDIYPIVKRNKLLVYFHPGDDQRANFERLLKAQPDILFIVHGDEIQGDIVSLMDKYPNIYYGVDAFWGPDMDLFHAFVGGSKEKYLEMMEKEFNAVLEYEVKKWTPVIEKHPDRFLWGTDRGDAVWNYDLEVGQMMVKFARAFIGRLDPKVQEKIAYKNAEAILKNAATMKDHAVSIGYVGCSNTRQTVEGYQLLGGTKMWPYEKRYDSGAVRDWALNAGKGNKYWDVFDELLERHPNTRSIWWQLCIRQEDDTKHEDALPILEAIRKRIPGVKIYVSPLPGYTDGVCGITGISGLEKAKELAQKLDAGHADVLPGPVLGPMTSADTDDDGCHLSIPDGLRKLGGQMKEFFR